MIPLPCLAPYINSFLPVDEPTELLPFSGHPRFSSNHPSWLPKPVFTVVNSYAFQPTTDDDALGQVLWQRLHVIKSKADSQQCDGCLKLECFYEVPRALGTFRVGFKRFEMNAVGGLVGDIFAQSQEQGWHGPHGDFDWSRVYDTQRKLIVAWHLYQHESFHDWTERILTARPFFDGLAHIGIDVRPDLERFLSNARA